MHLCSWSAEQLRRQFFCGQHRRFRLRLRRYHQVHHPVLQPARSLNYLTTATDLEMVVGANCVDTLVEYDNKGVMREGLATSWDWDADTLTWTFHLREENWVDNNGEVVAPVTAQDFVDALKYVLTPDYASSNVGLVTAYVAGAEDYYNYYVYLNNANTGVVDDDGTTYTADASGVVTVTSSDGTAETYSPVDFDTVGVKAVDDHTLTYTLTYDFPGFLSLLCYLPYEPAYGPCWKRWATSTPPLPRPCTAAAPSIWPSTSLWRLGS